MWFTHLTDPYTLAVLPFEGGVFLLALAAGFGRMVRYARWAAYGLVVLNVVLALIGAAVMLWEICTLRPPLVLPEAPFGTYTQPTVLRLLPLPAPFVLLGGVLAFRRPGLGGLVFALLGVWGLLNALNVLGVQDLTSPPGASHTILVFDVLPALAAGALLLATSCAEHPHRRHATGSAEYALVGGSGVSEGQVSSGPSS
jgi:hypothetical protein